MKKLLFILVIVTFSSFAERGITIFEISSIKKNYVKVKEDLYVSKYEVSNVDYRNFLSDMQNANQLESYQNCLPDTLCWEDSQHSTALFVQYYFRYPNYDNYPVVGVSYESAMSYCSWLTENYNQNAKRKFRKVYFKLLTKDEWIFAANKGDTSKVYTWGSGFIQNNRKQDLCNYRHIEYKYDSATKKYQPIEKSAIEKQIERSKITTSVNSYFPNSFGIYNMCGNVAEMVEEKGIAKGGSYIDPAYKVTISSEIRYLKPQSDIGFRVAMKVIEQ
jgi:formylglycine-generating enzyme required for sulfatase activity